MTIRGRLSLNMPNDRLEEEDDLNNRMVAILLKSLPAQEPLEVLSSRLLEVVVGDAIDDCLLLLMPADGGAHGADFETKVLNYRGKAVNLNKISEKIAPWTDCFDRALQQRVLVMPVADLDCAPVNSMLCRTLIRQYNARYIVLLPIRAFNDVNDDVHQSGVASAHYLLASRRAEAPLPTAVLTLLQQVSDLLSLYRHAREQRERLDDVRMMHRSILNAVNDMVFITLAQTRRNPLSAYVLLINRSFADYFGITNPFELIKKDRLSVAAMIEKMSKLSKQFHRPLKEAWDLSPRSDRIVDEGLTLTMGGQTRYLVWYSQPIVTDDGAIRGRIFTIRDVTGEIFLENARQESISRTLHELNTPMMTIKGYSDLLISMSDDMPKVRRYALLIQEAAQTLRSTFSNMVQVMRARAGTAKLHKTKANLNDLVIGVTALLEEASRARGQVIGLDIDDDIPLMIVDAIAIRQVITNLIVNAIKYAPVNTTITVETLIARTRKELPAHAPAQILLPSAVCIVKDQARGLKMPMWRRSFCRCGERPRSPASRAAVSV